MKSAINTVRWLFSITFGVLLSSVVFIAPLAIAVSSTVTNRDILKNWVVHSGIYEHVDEIAIELFKKQVKTESENKQLDAAEEALTEHNLEEVVNTVLTPSFSRNLVEGTVDGVYDYLEGKTERIIIKADREKVQNAFLQILLTTSDIQFDSVQEFTNLPTCTDEQEENLDKGFESIEDACLPQDPLLDKIFETRPGQDNNSFDITGGGIRAEEIEGNFPARGVFQIMKLTAPLLISVIILLTALTIIMIPHWKTALIVVGIFGILPSLFSLAIASLMYFADFAPQIITPFINDLSAQNAQLIEKSSQTIMKDISGKGMLYSALFVLAFSLILLSSKLIKTKEVAAAKTV